MAGASQPQDGAATTALDDAVERPAGAADRLPLRTAALVVVVLVAALTLVLVSGLPAGLRQLVGGAGLVLGGLTLAAACQSRFRRSEGRRRRAWLMFGGAAVSAATGNLWLTVTELGGAFGLLALGDGLLVVALVLVIAGLASYPSPPRRPLAPVVKRL